MHGKDLVIIILSTGFLAEPGTPGDLNFICPGSEITWNFIQKVKKPEQN